MFLTVVERVLWCCGILLQVWILWRMHSRGLNRNFRCFFLYIAFVLAKDLLLVLIYFFLHPAYIAAYWIGEAATIALSLMVLEEVVRNALRPFEGLRRIGMVVFALAVLLALGAAIASSMAPSHDTDGLTAAILVTQRGVRMMQVVLLLSLIAFSSVLRISWFDQGFGIMVGFGVFISLELSIVTIRASAGEALEPLSRVMAPLSFLGAQVVWAYYATRSVPVIVASSAPSETAASWKQALQGFLQR